MIILGLCGASYSNNYSLFIMNQKRMMNLCAILMMMVTTMASLLFVFVDANHDVDMDIHPIRLLQRTKKRVPAATTLQPITKSPTVSPTSMAPTKTPTTTAPTPTSAITKEELWNIHKTKWDTFLSNNPTHKGYQVVYQKSCFCIPDMKLPYRVSVDQDGDIAEIINANDGTPAKNAIVISNMLTIESAFQLIQDAWSMNANVVTVTYDETYGHPSYVYIDKSARTMDEEYSFTIQNVTLIQSQVTRAF